MLWLVASIRPLKELDEHLASRRWLTHLCYCFLNVTISCPLWFFFWSPQFSLFLWTNFCNKKILELVFIQGNCNLEHIYLIPKTPRYLLSTSMLHSQVMFIPSRIIDSPLGWQVVIHCMLHYVSSNSESWLPPKSLKISIQILSSFNHLIEI